MRNILFSTALLGSACFLSPAEASAQEQSGTIADYRATLNGFANLHKELNEHVSYGALAGPSYNLLTKELGAQGRLYANYSLTEKDAPVDVKAGLIVKANFTGNEFLTETVPTLGISADLDESSRMAFLNDASLIVELPFNSNLTIADELTVSIAYALPLGGKLKGKNLRAGARIDLQ